MKRLVDICLAACLLVITCVCTPRAYAITLTFEGLIPAGAYYAPIANGYGGLNWENFRVLDTSTYTPFPSGYYYGTVSGTNVAYNSWADPASIMTINSDVPILVHSAYLTGAWHDGLYIKAEGYLGNVLKYTKTVTVSAYFPTLVSYEFGNVDEVVWSSWGGTPAPEYSRSGTQFAMDDLNYDFAPEPSSLLALLSGIGGLGGLVWRKRK